MDQKLHVARRSAVVEADRFAANRAARNCLSKPSQRVCSLVNVSATPRALGVYGDDYDKGCDVPCVRGGLSAP